MNSRIHTARKFFGTDGLALVTGAFSNWTCFPMKNQGPQTVAAQRAKGTDWAKQKRQFGHHIRLKSLTIACLGTRNGLFQGRGHRRRCVKRPHLGRVNVATLSGYFPHPGWLAQLAGITNRVSLGHIASYLGIKGLSRGRIRATLGPK